MDMDTSKKMRLIAHRGNVDGVNHKWENTVLYAEEAIVSGFDVELDIWQENGNFYLGHDSSEHYVSWGWLVENRERLWLHCKNIQALSFFAEYYPQFQFFYHRDDNFTLTSTKHIWTFPGHTIKKKSICVLPESGAFFCDHRDWVTPLKKLECFGICSDYVEKIRNALYPISPTDVICGNEPFPSVGEI